MEGEIQQDLEEWKNAVKKSYLQWKSSTYQEEVENYFTLVQKSERGLVLKQDSKAFIEKFRSFFDDIEKDEGKIVKKDDRNKINFLRTDIDVGDATEEEVDKFVKDTVFGEFKKEFSKIFDSAEKSVGDFLKQILKSTVDFLEAGFKKPVLKLGQIVAETISWLFPLPDYIKDQETGVLSIPEYEFKNYGETVKNTPRKTFFPKTLKEIQGLVKYAKKEGKRLRAAGMRHSWPSLFSNTNELLLCLLPLAVTDSISYARCGDHSIDQQIKDWGSEFSFIEVVKDLGDGHAAVKVGAATTNIEMLNWSKESSWTLPLDVIAIMITYGGSNAPICHGAGLQHKTLSDLVIGIEFVNANGELQKVDDPEKLKAVSGCFGLAGIVTAITFKMDKTTYAKFQPKKNSANFKMVQAIPRPGTPREDPTFTKMVDLCENHYYTEFFWFPNHGSEEGFWQNCWNNDGQYPPNTLNSAVDFEYQVASSFLFELAMKILKPLTLLPSLDDDIDSGSQPGWLRYFFTKAISLAALTALPAPENPITTTLVEALHFRRGFHYIVVRDMEMEIPVPSLPDGSPDWSILPRAWWDAVDLIEKSADQGLYACDLTLEGRVMGCSEVLMAPQFGNKHGTISIEVLSTRIVPQKTWEDFKVKLAEVWMSYKDHDGTPLHGRVHWAKEMPRTVTFQGESLPIVEYDHKVYATNMEMFFKTLSNLTEKVSIGDISRLFSNTWLDRLFKPEWERYGIEPPPEDTVKSETPVPGTCCIVL